MDSEGHNTSLNIAKNPEKCHIPALKIKKTLSDGVITETVSKILKRKIIEKSLPKKLV